MRNSSVYGSGIGFGMARVVLAAGLAIAANASAGGIEFEVAGTWAPPAGETLLDLGGWNGVVVTRSGFADAGVNKTTTLDLRFPADPVILDATSGFGLRGQFGCDFFWEEAIEVKNGRYQFTQAIFCTIDAGGQKGFSLEQSSDSGPLPGQGPSVVGFVAYSDGDNAGLVSGGIGAGFVATYRQNDDLVYLDGVDAQMGLSGEIDTDDTGPIPQSFWIEGVHADGMRVYLRSRESGINPLYAFDVSDLANPVLLYEWEAFPLHIGGGLGYIPNGNDLDVYDLMPESGPVLLGAFDSPGAINSMYTYEGQLYIAADTGLFVYDLTSPASPALAGSYIGADGTVERLGFGLGQVHMLVGNAEIVSLVIPGVGPCGPVDFVEPYGVLDLADIQTFVGAFVGQFPLADLAAPEGVFDLADLQTFIIGFNAGCP